MTNDSTTPGYLTSTAADPLYDEALEQELSRWVRAITGLPEGMVRPRWTPEQDAQPPTNTNWCAFGIIEWTVDNSPAFTEQTDTRTLLWRHEDFVAMASFYGPAGMQFASQFRDGISVEQNNAELNQSALSLVDYSAIVPFPELINQQWARRYDVKIRLRRKVVREYNILALQDAPVSFFGE